MKGRARLRSNAEGASLVERRRREGRGGGVFGGVPLPTGGWVWGEFF